jgi:hypothetical protein
VPDISKRTEALSGGWPDISYGCAGAYARLGSELAESCLSVAISIGYYYPDASGKGMDLIWVIVGRDATAMFADRLPADVLISADERLVVIPGSMLAAAKPDIPDA